MEMLGLCARCGRPARFTCMLCGALVCKEHFDISSHMCTDCAMKKKGTGDLPRPEDMLR